ncbi:MAG: Asp-tRNA(Asn)/Glu-tRNA(Gln) amidotransferase subunit GatC [Gammaproteobacteria bacterium]|nr:Asp-tRNA(Asn)/Glu-tRNA(Gln) amidotransferase subunit GatC [Gammaproteobacteria bacterium]
MSVTQHDLERLGDLARIAIAVGQESDHVAALSRVIDLVAELQAVAVAGVEPMSNPHDQTAELRPDLVTETDRSALFQQLAPATRNGLYLVPQVIG